VPQSTPENDFAESLRRQYKRDLLAGGLHNKSICAFNISLNTVDLLYQLAVCLIYF
jgi:hypothetical protein